MNFVSRLILSVTSVGLLGSGFWIVLMPHLLIQYIAVMGASTLFGGAIFAITDNNDNNNDNDDEMSENIKRMKEEAKIEENKKKIIDEINEPLIFLRGSTNNITNPNIARKFYRICDIGDKINKYAYDNNCMDKVMVWDTVYVTKIVDLVNEYNTIVKIPDPSMRVVTKIDEFGKLANDIMDKFQQKYEDMISGKVESFDIDMTLVRQLHDN